MPCISSSRYGIHFIEELNIMLNSKQFFGEARIQTQVSLTLRAKLLLLPLFLFSSSSLSSHFLFLPFSLSLSFKSLFMLVLSRLNRVK